MNANQVANLVRDLGIDPHEAALALVNAIAVGRGYPPPWPTAPHTALPALGSVFEIGDVHQLLLGGQDGQRGNLGSYYTPEVLAQTTTRLALHMPLDTRHPLEIVACDPACGAGVLLVQAGQQLTRAYLEVEFDQTDPADWMVRAALPMVASECLFGIDIDPVAVDLAKSALWLESGGSPPISWMDRNIICDDAVSGPSAIPPRLAERKPAPGEPDPSGGAA